jgi:hypothetical protein
VPGSCAKYKGAGDRNDAANFVPVE